MKTHFDIGDFKGGLLQSHQVICELGENYLSLAGLNMDNAVTAWRIVRFQKTELEATVTQITNDLFERESTFEKVLVVAAFPQSILIPADIFEKENNYILSVFDDKQQKQLYDIVPERKIVNVYSLPQTVLKKFERTGKISFTHIHTCNIKNIDFKSDLPFIEVYFISNYFRVLVVKGGQIILAQMYTYAAPMDVLYYLLKICKEFDIEQNEVSLLLYGFIDEDSALYKELYNYFMDISFKASTISTISENNYPQHFFTSLNNLVACV